MKKFIEAHSGISAVLVDKSYYDGIWVSSLTHATQKGLPDNELVPLKERVDMVEEFRKLTNKPIIVDVDTFGSMEHIPFYANWFNKAGAYAVIMEDKKYPKQNSLLEENKHQMEDVNVFAKKIEVAKAHSGDTKVFARLESLIAKESMEAALIRAEAYLKAGADGIMIHSKQQIDASEVMEFAKRFREAHPDVTLIAVPTTYELPSEHPFEIVIYANHLMRASIKAMQKVLIAEDPKEVEMVDVKEIFDLLGH